MHTNVCYMCTSLVVTFEQWWCSFYSCREHVDFSWVRVVSQAPVEATVGVSRLFHPALCTDLSCASGEGGEWDVYQKIIKGRLPSWVLCLLQKECEPVTSWEVACLCEACNSIFLSPRSINRISLRLCTAEMCVWSQSHSQHPPSMAVTLPAVPLLSS